MLYTSCLCGGCYLHFNQLPPSVDGGLFGRCTGFQSAETLHFCCLLFLIPLFGGCDIDIIKFLQLNLLGHRPTENGALYCLATS